jgi:uncharacterized protein YbjT (DUF2867 family)
MVSPSARPGVRAARPGSGAEPAAQEEIAMRHGTTILVTGARGQVGRQVVRALQERGVGPRIFVRSSEGHDAPPEGVEIARGDFEDARSIESALRGIERVFVVCSPTAELPRLERNVYEAARRIGVRLVVKASILGATPDAIPFRAVQGQAERLLAASGLPHVVLRPNYFLQNVLAAAKTMGTRGVYEDAAAGARLSMVDLRDVGDAAATILCTEGHEGKAYDLTGPAALSGEDIAQAASTIAGRVTSAEDLDPAEQRQRFAAYGVPEWVNAALESLYRDYRASGPTGYAARVTEDVPRLVGRRARNLVSLLRENASAFR